MQGASSGDDEEEDQQPLQFKIVLLGADAVGKTAISSAAAGCAASQTCAIDALLALGAFPFISCLARDALCRPKTCVCLLLCRYRRTVGVDFYGARVTLPGEPRGAALQLWDVGSGVGSLQVAAAYIHGCDAVLMVHDLTRQQVAGCVKGRARSTGMFVDSVRHTAGCHRTKVLSVRCARSAADATFTPPVPQALHAPIFSGTWPSTTVSITDSGSGGGVAAGLTTALWRQPIALPGPGRHKVRPVMPWAAPARRHKR
jgi:hypothetical protein